MNRRIVFFGLTSVLLVAAAGHLVQAGTRSPFVGNAISLAEPGQIVFRNTRPGPGSGHVATVPLASPGGPRTVSSVACARISVTAGSGVCLSPGRAGFSAVLLDNSLTAGRSIAAPGVPNRARVSSDGSLIAWTAFVTGHSYAASGFSTRTSILDSASGKYYGDIETLQLFHEGSRVRAPDVNIWGVTFTPDRKHFYATASWRGTAYVISADIETWSAHTLVSNAECPSLSPDGRFLVFKRRYAATGVRPWELAVHELASHRETALPGTQGIDDQAVWLDSKTVIYALSSGVWASASDGTGTSRLLIADAESPSVLTGAS